ncbi:MAG TPA: glycosyltransferase family 2 protein [bacterium]
MQSPNKIGVVIPAYNAERTIGQLIQDLIDYGFKKENIIVVDDGSQDKTAVIAERCGVRVLKNSKNTGKGWVLNQGFDEARKNGLQKVITMDADGQHRVNELNEFLNSNGDFDVIIGSRRNDRAPMPISRKFTNRTTSLVISLLSNRYIPDVQSGYRLIDLKIFDRVRLRTRNFQTESELACKAGLAGYRIGSVPIKTIYGNEKSYILPVMDTIRFIRMAVGFLWR